MPDLTTPKAAGVQKAAEGQWYGRWRMWFVCDCGTRLSRIAVGHNWPCPTCGAMAGISRDQTVRPIYERSHLWGFFPWRKVVGWQDSWKYQNELSAAKRLADRRGEQ